MALILAITLALTYKAKADGETRQKGKSSMLVNFLLLLTTMVAFLLLLAWVCLQILPLFANMISLKQLADDTGDNAGPFKQFFGLTITKCVILLLTWCLNTFSNESAIAKEELDPYADQDEENEQDREGPEMDEKGGEPQEEKA